MDAYKLADRYLSDLVGLLLARVAHCHLGRLICQGSILLVRMTRSNLTILLASEAHSYLDGLADIS